MKVWIATVVDSGETCDGKARTLGAFNTKEEAKQFINSDIVEWSDNHASEDVVVDFEKMSAHNNGNGEGSEWNVEEVEIPFAIPYGSPSKAEEVLKSLHIK